MKTSIVYILVLIVTIAIPINASRAAERPFGAPEYPPEDWDLWLIFRLCDGFTYEMVGIQPPGEDSSHDEWLNFRNLQEVHNCDAYRPYIDILVDNDVLGCGSVLTGSDDNLLVNPDALLEDRSFSDVIHLGFLTVPERPRIYDAALAACAEFTFSQTYPPTDTGEDGMARLIALMKRNLPQRYNRLFDLFDLPDIKPLSEDEKDKYDACTVHNISLVPTTVVKMGSGWNKRYDEVKKNKFPFSNEVIDVDGPCDFGNDFTRVYHVLYCPECRKSRQEWLKDIQDLDEYRIDWAKEKKQSQQ